MSDLTPETIAGGAPDRASVPRRATSLLTVMTTVAALTLAGGVVTAAWRSTSDSRGPATLIPASAFAVGTIDLSLPDGQAHALMTLADRFPDSPTHSGDGSAADRLLRALFHASTGTRVDYDRDVKPWVGDHVAVAGWVDAAGRPQMEAVVQSTDDNAARAELTKLLGRGHGAVRFADGYAVVADTDALAARTIASAHHASLAGTASYTGDVDALPGTPVATGWVDGPGVRKALTAAMEPGAARMFGGGMNPFALLGPLGMLGSAGMLGAAPGMSPGTGVAPGMGSGMRPRGDNANSLLDGRFAVGVRVTGDYVEVDSRSIGRPAGHQSDSSSLTALPASTIAAVELGDPAALVSGATNALRGFLSFQALPTHLSRLPVPALPSSGPCMGHGPVPPATTVPRDLPHRRALLRELRQLRRHHNDPGCSRMFRVHPPGMHAFHPPAEVDPLARLRATTGLDLPADATTLLGDSVVVSYGGVDLGAGVVPKVAVRTHPADLAAARAVADRLQQRLSSSRGMDISVGTVGSDLLLATTSGYAADVEHGIGFGDQDQVRLALGGLPSHVTAAGYVNLADVLPLLGSHLPADLVHLKAAGFWSTGDGDVQTSQLRLIIG